jgi:membrane associated rhomboid family serine protease
MIPLKDLTPRRSVPIVTLLLIAVNVATFLHQISLPPPVGDLFINTYGLVPAKIQLALAGEHYTLAQALLPLFTCMFLHGGILHILGNMWFLWIFGGNVEDRLGAVVYLLFYLLCGVGSGLAQAVFSWGSQVPSIGASGAISGVLGLRRVLPPVANLDAPAAVLLLVHGANTRDHFHRAVVRCAVLERAQCAWRRNPGSRRGRGMVGSRRRLPVRNSLGVAVAAPSPPKIRLVGVAVG